MSTADLTLLIAYVLAGIIGGSAGLLYGKYVFRERRFENK